MSLGARKGDELVIRAKGPDAAAAVAALKTSILTASEPADGPAGAAEPPSTAAGLAPAAQLNIVLGITASPGIATGVAFNLVRPALAISESASDEHAETAALERARSSVRAELTESIRTAQGAARDIASAHLEFLEDAELLSAAAEWIARGKSAAYAWRSALRGYAEVIASLPDPRMAERASDLHDLEYQVIAALTGKSGTAAYALPERAIVLANELLPSQFVALDKSRLAENLHGCGRADVARCCAGSHPGYPHARSGRR